jgi:hypothetical protein
MASPCRSAPSSPDCSSYRILYAFQRRFYARTEVRDTTTARPAPPRDHA